jgi:hypothetical protein
LRDGSTCFPRRHRLGPDAGPRLARSARYARATSYQDRSSTICPIVIRDGKAMVPDHGSGRVRRATLSHHRRHCRSRNTGREHVVVLGSVLVLDVGGYSPDNPFDALLVGYYNEAGSLLFAARVRARLTPASRRLVFRRLRNPPVPQAGSSRISAWVRIDPIRHERVTARGV